MSAEFLYTPEKLIKARKEVQQKLSVQNEPDFNSNGEELKALIERLDKVPENMVKATSFALSQKDINTLAGYIPYNFYNIDESQICDLLSYRMDREACNVLFTHWQESFDNPQCNSFIEKQTVLNDNFRNILRKCHIDPEVFRKILRSRNVPISYEEELIGTHFVNADDINEKLKYYGVIDQSFLDMECKRALLAFCSKADYLSCSEENVLDIISGYDLFVLRKFVINFLDKLSLSELQIYPSVAEYLRRVTGHRKSGNFKSFFEDVDQFTIQKYLDWINIYKINEYFDNDERSRFWKQYRYLNVIKYPVSNTVVLEFDRYVVIEFLGYKKGTIYICEKESFRQVFYEKINAMNNDSLRDYFKIYRDQCVLYRNHSGRWQNNVANTIDKLQIGSRIRI